MKNLFFAALAAVSLLTPSGEALNTKHLMQEHMANLLNSIDQPVHHVSRPLTLTPPINLTDSLSSLLL